MRVDRRGWTSAQWVEDARRLMAEEDGAVTSLVNGHVTHLLTTLDRAREAGWEPGRWWRVMPIDRQDDPRAVWCETSNEAQAREALKTCPGGGVLQRLHERSESEWRPAN